MALVRSRAGARPELTSDLQAFRRAEPRGRLAGRQRNGPRPHLAGSIRGLCARRSPDETEASSLVGGAVLVWLAIRTIRARPAESPASAEEPSGLAGALLSIYGLTMTNPATILSFAGIFAGLGLADGNGVDAAVLTFGVFLGSSLWWVVLTSIVGRVRGRITTRVLMWINWISGAALLVFGLVAIAHAILVAAGRA